MKKFAAIGLGVALAAATLTTSPQPAKADPALWILGGLVVGALVIAHHHPSFHSLHPWNSHHHVNWCESRYQTYDRSTDLYFYKPGQQRRCRSPYS